MSPRGPKQDVYLLIDWSTNRLLGVFLELRAAKDVAANTPVSCEVWKHQAELAARV